MSHFDTVLMVDWSGGNDRGAKPVKDAIWACVARAGAAEAPVYLRNRQVAEAWITEQLEAELEAGRRVLAGFDFPFGYPRGYAAALTGLDDPLALWDWYAAHVTDEPGANNRFDLAAEINLRFGGKGPFWANGLPGRDIDGLPRTKADYENPFADRRQAETQAKGAFTCWQMAGAGAVGSQVFMGLPVLARLRARLGDAVSVWPFQPLETPVALVEIWPSLTVGAAPEGMIKDAWQVCEVARSVSALAPEVLADILAVEASEEGWIFGLGHEEILRSQPPAPPPLRNDCFALPAGVDWTPVQDALALLRAGLTPVTAVESLPASRATGRIVAEDVRAVRANPPLPNTAVDGYGFAGGRDAGAHVMPLAEGRAAAGDAPRRVPDGMAIRVLTGAALPEGVDTVVLQEDVTLGGGQIAFQGPVRQGANTRNAGEDVHAGEIILEAGSRIGPPQAALLAATGVGDVPVRKPLRVGVLSTGDEVVEAGTPALPGQIYDANRPMLLSMITAFGHEPVDMGRVGDDREALRARLDQAAGRADVIMTSGGASAGDEDHVSALLRAAGAMELWRIAVKPGRPLALGLWSGVPVFGLPGNPVAALVCALIFAHPAMARLAGQAWPVPQGFDVPAAFSKRKKPGRTEFLRARIREGAAEVFGSEGSGRISGLSWADGLVELGPEARDVRPGDSVRYIPFAAFGL